MKPPGWSTAAWLFALMLIFYLIIMYWTWEGL